MSDDRPAIANDYLGALVSRIVRAVEAVLPKGFRGKITIGEIDNGRIRHHDVAVEYRAPQPRKGGSPRLPGLRKS